MKRGLTVRMPMPALLTSRSIPPRRAHDSSTHARTECSSRTSSASPIPPTASAARCARVRSRLVNTTRAPSALSAPAIARPDRWSRR
jgi:hypothetical protein